MFYLGSRDISASLRKGNKYPINYNTDGVILNKVICDKQPEQVRMMEANSLIKRSQLRI